MLVCYHSVLYAHMPMRDMCCCGGLAGYCIGVANHEHLRPMQQSLKLLSIPSNILT